MTLRQQEMDGTGLNPAGFARRTLVARVTPGNRGNGTKRSTFEPQVPLEGCVDCLRAIRSRASSSRAPQAVIRPRPGRVARAVRTALQNAEAPMQVRAIHRA